ncbi:ABC transporter permease [Actinopolymorpha sp. B11F2]|uniref:ABC transporter permease n=1 Tax=Actinopolymorpha sp. B11F2 TaxID=3160862 RepID=UPI0032E530AC
MTVGQNLVGTGGLIRLILRRDRVLLPLWVFLLALVPVSGVAATRELVSTQAELQQYADTSGTNPAFLALYGPLYDVSLGGVIAQRMGMFPVILALICALTVIRHTRTEEEAGRRDLLGATVIGRQANLAAALIVVLGANLVLALVIALGMIGQDLPVAGSVAFGLSFALAGWVFAAVGGVAAQLTEGAGAARGLALTVLGAAFVLRLAGDIGGEGNGASWLSGLSPIGWAHQIRSYGDERWWILVPAGVLVLGLVTAAFLLSARRDVGAGVLPPRLGPASASPRLRGTLGLAWRLQRGLLVSWTAGLTVLGLVYGGVAWGVRDMLKGNREMEEIFARMGGSAGIVDATLAAMLGIIGLIASAYAIQATLRMRAEETSLRLEPVLGTAVGRVRWMASHLVFALLGPTVALAAAGLAAGFVHGLNADDVGGQLPRVFAGAMVQLPAVWTLAAVAVALFGLLPRIAAASWAAFGLCLFLGWVGALLQLDQVLLDASPFTHLPKLPGGDVTAEPFVWLAGVVVVLVAVGLVGFRRRDVPVT